MRREQPRSLNGSDATHYGFSDGGSAGVLSIGLLTGVTRRSQGRSDSRRSSGGSPGVVRRQSLFRQVLSATGLLTAASAA